MLGSLRFRLPALFLLAVVLSGVVATVISIRFFQSYTRTRAIAELRVGVDRHRPAVREPGRRGGRAGEDT